MKKRNKLILGLATIFIASTVQAQQSTSSELTNKGDAERTERQHSEKKVQHYAQPEAVDRTEAQQHKQNDPQKKESSANGIGNTRMENDSRNPNAEPSPRSTQSYRDMSNEDREAMIEKLEKAIAQNESNPDFNRESYQKRIDLLQSLNE